MKRCALRFLQFTLTTFTLQAAVAQIARPTVRLDEAVVVGATNDSVTTFSGIPYAHAPKGDLRLRLPKPIDRYGGVIDATQLATQCIQLTAPIRTDLPPEMAKDLESYLAVAALATPPDTPEGEDCLNLNIRVPAGTQSNAKLPVLVYIFGGAFTVGSSTQTREARIVQRSVEMKQPVVYVAMNYRLHVFGFLGGKQVKEAGVGNLGLHDQRLALRWIQKNIAAFGGDPKKVTIWGPSAGAMSVGLQMLANGGDEEGLFRGAVMDAGSPLPTGDILNVQLAYDTVVEHSGCASSRDTLECLRQIPAENLTVAAATIPNLFEYPGSFLFPWLPRADGIFLTDAPQRLILCGKVSKVPFIAGDALDEGTIFATGAYNVSTESQFRNFVHQSFFPTASEDEVAPLFDLYPNDPAQGSPFGTGDANQLAPMYKRTAAFKGDLIFQAPRRFLLEEQSSKQPAWSFRHGSDILAALLGNELLDYIIQFTATLDPNGGSNRTIAWPKYDVGKRRVLTLNDGADHPLTIGNDSLRLVAMAGLTAVGFAHPL